MNHELLELRIGDLIEVPDVQTVIDLSEIRDLDPDDPDGRVALENLGSSFIITDDIHSILSIILNHLNRKEGHGFFIVGNYGSGKSHLLSILGLIARYSWARQSVFKQRTDLPELVGSKKSPRFLPVVVPLTEFSGDLPLEKIVWHAIEISAALVGIPLTLSSTQRFIEVFNRYILPVHENDFRQFVHLRFKDLTWEQICGDDPPAAHTIILQFSERHHVQIPFDVIIDRSVLLKELIQAVVTAGWDGVLLVMDELSEFLKSKPVSRAVHEDTRFLQFLGEASIDEPFWVTAALQESLEHNQDVSTSAFNKIRSRYTHLKLTTKHLHQLISKRLIRKKSADSERVITRLFEVLKNAFNRMDITRETFLNLYPIHPETIELLNRNVDLFSQRRGIVDFVFTRIRGRQELNIDGILMNPCHQLLTPDVIFDHFQDRLIQSDRYSSYVQLYQQQLLPRIKTHFPDADEQMIAIRSVKVLILLAITPFEERRTTRELANMVLYRVFDSAILGGDANYAFFEERIIRVIYQSVGFLSRIPGKTRMDDVYIIEQGTDPALHVDDRIQRIKSGLSPDVYSVFPDLVQSMGYGAFPLVTFFRSTSIRETVNWQNTRRRMSVRLMESQDLLSDEIKKLRLDLQTGKVDFVCIFIIPDNDPDQHISIQKFLATEPSPDATGWGIIAPMLPDALEFENALLEVQACKLLLQEVGQTLGKTENLPILEILRDRFDRHVATASSYLQSSYLSGVLFLTSETKTLAGRQSSAHFDKWLEMTMGDALGRRYPEHYKLAPRCDFQSKVLQDMIVDNFVRPGASKKLLPGKDDILISALDSVAIPLGIAQKKAGIYHLVTSARKSVAVRLIIDQLPLSTAGERAVSNQTVSAGRVWRHVNRPPYGMSRSVFDLVLMALIRKGYVTAYKESQIVPMESLHLPLTGQIDRLSRGNLIPDNLRPAFFRAYKFFAHKNLTEIDLESQDVLSNKVSSTLTDWAVINEKFEMMFTEWNRQGRETPNLIEVTHHLQQIRQIDREFSESEIGTYAGWVRFLTAFSLLDDPDVLMQSIKRISDFLETGLQRFTLIYNYMHQLNGKIPESMGYLDLHSHYSLVMSSLQLNDRLILDDGLKILSEQFDKFKGCYRQLYLTEHKHYKEPATCLDSVPPDHVRERQLLKILSRIGFFSKIQSIRQALEFPDVVNKLYCQFNPESSLDSTPFCSCGYSLGCGVDIKESLPSGAVYLDLIQYCLSILQKLINDFDWKAHDLSNELRRKLIFLRDMEPGDPSLVCTFSTVLDDDVVIFFNQIDSTIRHPIRLSCNELFSNFKDRTLTAGDARCHILKWLKNIEKLADGDWVHFID
ncbi:hypothetical protein JW823_02170 [bacterium]|nr:hypothetical protein [candidate division CSSED10-310 bacterium]